jgi:hypothetical protein
MNYVYECGDNNYLEPYCNCWQPSVQTPMVIRPNLWEKDPNVVKEMVKINQLLFLVK